MKGALMLLGAALAISNSAYAASASSKPTEKTEQQIREAARRYEQAWKRGDVRAMVNEYTSDATYLTSDGTEAKGKAEIAERINEDFTEGDAQGSQIKLNVDDIQMLGSNMALIDLHQTLTPSPQAATGGSGAPPQELHSVVVGVKQGNTWKIKAVRSLPAPGEQPQGVGGSGQQQQQQQQPEEAPLPEPTTPEQQMEPQQQQPTP